MIHYAVVNSPYARKCRVVALEKGLADPGLTPPSGDPWTADRAFVAANPLAKVPTLVTDDGLAIFDSPVICDYLDSLAPEPWLHPTDAGRWVVLTRAALADGIMDAAVAARGESLRADGERSDAQITKLLAVIGRGLDRLEAEIEAFSGVVRIDAIAIACALGYLDLRFPQLDWRQGRPALAAWEAVFAERPSMRATRPQA